MFNYPPRWVVKAVSLCYSKEGLYYIRGIFRSMAQT